MAKKKLRDRVYRRVVKDCYSCPNRVWDLHNEEVSVCASTDMKIEDICTIPDWCPLDIDG